MQKYNVILTWEAIYDVVDIADYIEVFFGKQRADRFQRTMRIQIDKLGVIGRAFSVTQLMYRGYVVHKKPFPPAVIFYVIIEETREIHVLRILREGNNWEDTLRQQQEYTYPNGF